MSNSDVSKLVRDFEAGARGSGDFSLVYADLVEMKHAGVSRAQLNQELYQANSAMVQDGTLQITNTGLPPFVLVDADFQGHIITANPQTQQLEARDLNFNVVGTVNSQYGDPYRFDYPTQQYDYGAGNQGFNGQNASGNLQGYVPENQGYVPNNYQGYVPDNYQSSDDGLSVQYGDQGLPQSSYVQGNNGLGSQYGQYGDQGDQVCPNDYTQSPYYQTPMQPVQASQPTGSNVNQLMSLGLNLNDPTDKIVAMLAQSEGGPQSINWDDLGSGISVGPYQANQKGGPLSTLFQAMFKADPTEFRNIFQDNTSALLNQSSLRGLQFTKNNQLGQELQQALQVQTFQKVELDLDRQRISGFAAEATNNYGVTSAQGIALYCYMMNWGPVMAHKYFASARSQTDQNAKIQAVLAAAQANGNGDAVTRMNSTLARAGQLGLDSNQTLSA